MKKALIIADENIPKVREFFSPLAEVRTFEGRTFDAVDVTAADALLVRSVTPVDARLLAGSAVRFVGTATIGFDHLDCDYLSEHGIQWASAPGSNATSVVEYVISALCTLPGILEALLKGGEVGIIGMGNVGGRLYQRLNALGVRCLGYDPLISPSSFPILTNLERVLQADVICLHTPLSVSGDFPTNHMIGNEQLLTLKPNAVLLNAARGAVVDNLALRRQLQKGLRLITILDVWENEPYINLPLMQQVTLGTPHIAGYSLDGRLRGTEMIYRAYCRYLRIDPDPALRKQADHAISVNRHLHGANLIRQVVSDCYAIAEDAHRMRAALLADIPKTGLIFDRLRKSYPVRREFSACHISNCEELDDEQLNCLSALGFLHNL